MVHPGDLLDERPIREFVGMAARSGTYRERGTVERAVARTEGLVRLHRTLDRLGYITTDGPTVGALGPLRGGPVAQGKALAAHVREQRGLGYAPIDDLVALAEHQLGLHVLIDYFGEGFDGLCVHDDGFALAVVNSAGPAGRQRFTLAHELCHHLLGDLENGLHVDERVFGGGGNPSEVRANAFAAYFLMPPAGVREIVEYPFRTETAARVQHRFGASLQTVAYHLTNLRIIDERGRARTPSHWGAPAG